jgi:hypothetical protein
MIKAGHHFKSGVTEAGYYVGLAFIYFGVLWFDEYENITYACFGVLVFAFASIRYLDLLSIGASIFCFVLVLFLVFDTMLGIMPFLIMAVFLALYFTSRRMQKNANLVLWENHFIVFDSLALLLIYLGGNYFVVREMSVEMMRLELNEGQDIPLAFVFYVLTFLVPVLYLVIGVMKREMMLIRVGVLTILLSVVTIKYYYSFGHPEITVTLAGGVLVFISLGLMKYLKISRKGFTREKLLSSKWEDSNLTAFIASQTLGGHQVSKTEKFAGKGGEFGGGGASGGF